MNSQTALLSPPLSFLSLSLSLSLSLPYPPHPTIHSFAALETWVIWIDLRAFGDWGKRGEERGIEDGGTVVVGTLERNECQ